MTNQQIADLMLQADWARRAAMRRGDYVAARDHRIERDWYGYLLDYSENAEG